MKAKHTPYWYRVIHNAIKRQKEGLIPFSDEHRRKADVWVTCACGRQDPKLLKPTGGPYDVTLFKLGVMFSGNVDRQQPDRALKTLGEIEKRADYLLQKQEKTS